MMSGLKQYKEIPVYVVEDHNDVVPHIHKGIGSKHLPVSDLVFVHFDSHPDLLIPFDLQASDVYNKQTLYDTISIENWIIPLVFAGHINHVIWLKPPWCEQIQDKQIKFFVGRCKSSGCIRTTCKENYYVSEALYCPENQLENKKEVTLAVVTVTSDPWDPDKSSPSLVSSNDSGITGPDSNNVAAKRLCTEESKDGKKLDLSEEMRLSEHLIATLQKVHGSFKDKQYILDIDLDFFSTQNPFRLMFPDDIYGIIKELYLYEKPLDNTDKAIQICNMRRDKQLSDLKKIFSSLQEDSGAVINHTKKDLIVRLRDHMLKSGDEADFLLLHEAGCTCDDTELPHHVSTQGQITQLISAVQETLSYFHKPLMITMARSSNGDEYCPPDQVNSIQELAIEMLRDLYLRINVTIDYEQYDSKSA